MKNNQTSALKVVTNLKPDRTYSEKEYTRHEEELIAWRRGYWKYHNKYHESLGIIAVMIVIMVVMLFTMIGVLI